MVFSRSVKNNAAAGLSGTKNQTTADQSTVKPPQTRNFLVRTQTYEEGLATTYYKLPWCYATTCHVSYSIREQTSYDLSDPNQRIPCSDSGSLLITRVPDSSDVGPSRLNAGFEYSHKNPYGGCTGKVLTSCHKHDQNTPYQDVDGCKFSKRELLHEIVGWAIGT
jgi:hypothetical protein